MAATYDLFLSHAWADGERPQQMAIALTQAGLRVWFDANEINDFSSITHAVTEGLAQSKALVAYYSKTYHLRRACQWELTAALLGSQAGGDPRRRVLVINPEKGAEHIPSTCGTKNSSRRPTATWRRCNNWFSRLSSMWPRSTGRRPPSIRSARPTGTV